MQKSSRDISTKILEELRAVRANVQSALVQAISIVSEINSTRQHPEPAAPINPQIAAIRAGLNGELNPLRIIFNWKETKCKVTYDGKEDELQADEFWLLRFILLYSSGYIEKLPTQTRPDTETPVEIHKQWAYYINNSFSPEKFSSIASGLNNKFANLVFGADDIRDELTTPEQSFNRRYARAKAKYETDYRTEGYVLRGGVGTKFKPYNIFIFNKKLGRFLEISIDWNDKYDIIANPPKIADFDNATDPNLKEIILRDAVEQVEHCDKAKELMAERIERLKRGDGVYDEREQTITSSIIHLIDSIRTRFAWALDKAKEHRTESVSHLVNIAAAVGTNRSSISWTDLRALILQVMRLAASTTREVSWSTNDEGDDAGVQTHGHLVSELAYEDDQGKTKPSYDKDGFHSAIKKLEGCFRPRLDLIVRTSLNNRQGIKIKELTWQLLYDAAKLLNVTEDGAIVIAGKKPYCVVGNYDQATNYFSLAISILLVVKGYTAAADGIYGDTYMRNVMNLVLTKSKIQIVEDRAPLSGSPGEY